VRAIAPFVPAPVLSRARARRNPNPPDCAPQGLNRPEGRRAPLSSAIGLMQRKEHAMTSIRCTDNDFDNARMNNAGFEIIAIETYNWPDGHSETEILWGKDGPLEERELPF
jgi:hypothetical protein